MFLFMRLKHLCLSSEVFLSSPTQPVLLHWSHAKPTSILFGQDIADNVRDCNQASSCLHASSRLQELKELRLQKPWHELWEMYIEIHVLPLTCWATPSEKAEQQPLGAAGPHIPLDSVGDGYFLLWRCHTALVAWKLSNLCYKREVGDITDVGQWGPVLALKGLV